MGSRAGRREQADARLAAVRTALRPLCGSPFYIGGRDAASADCVAVAPARQCQQRRRQQAQQAVAPAAASPSSAPGDGLTVVAFGDSITAAGETTDASERWPSLLRAKLELQLPELAAPVVVHNRGVGGETSREGLRRFREQVLACSPDFVVIEFGNDATEEPDRHVPVPEFVANFERVAAELQQLEDCQLVLMTFPPIRDEWHSKHYFEVLGEISGQDEGQNPYREATRRLARDRHLPLVDIDTGLREHGIKPLPDGIHLSAEGNEFVASQVADAIVAVWSRKQGR